MKIGINQPYLFPYLGYFQLINAVDVFVFIDDSNFIKKGWINRNSILLNGQPFLFTVPLKKASQNKLINQTKLNSENYKIWWIKFSKTLEQFYKNAPFFQPVFEIVCDVMENPKNKSISDLATYSIEAVMNYLSIDTKLEFSSSIPLNEELRGENRILEINSHLNAETYINLPGGVDLYSKKKFSENNINLKFLNSKSPQYKQFDQVFVPNLSILDVLMFNDIEQIKKMLDEYTYL